MKSNTRIEWIDIAKGIGIILVIAGHTIQYTLVMPIYAFHMPLFFFMSGLLLKPEQFGDFNSFFKKKGRQLIKPWLIMAIISSMVCIIIPIWRSEMTVQNLIRDFYTSNTNVIQNSSLWYLPCFFFALVIYYIINHFYKGDKNSRVLFLIYSLSLLLLPNFLDIIPLPYGRLPFKIDTALIATVFIGVASWNKNSISSLIENHSGAKYCIGVLLLCIIASVCNGSANMNSLELGRFRILYYPVAFIGIYAVAIISSYISKSKLLLIKNFFKFYGINSLLIFGFQSLYIRLYLLFFNSVYDLDMKLYAANPYIHQLASFFVVTFILSPVTVLFFQFLKNKGFKIL